MAKEKETEQRYYYKREDGSSYLEVANEIKDTDIGGYVAITEEEFNKGVAEYFENSKEKANKVARIAYLKNELAKTDYVAIKIAEGEATKNEYKEIIDKRKAWRVEINKLEEEVK